MRDVVYALGHAPREVRRLEHQADILRPLTLRLLRESGLQPDMRVLDIGTGAGDVAMLAAEIVGNGGSVIGIDRNDAVLTRARARAEAARMPQVRFEQADLKQAHALGTFDLVVCRFVLMHQADPVAFLRSAAALVGNGGRLAALELASRKEHCLASPRLDLYDEIIAEIFESFALAGSDLAVGLRLVDLFTKAGLPEPQLCSEAPVGGPASPIPVWAVQTWASMRPTFEKLGRPSHLDPDPDLILDRLCSAAEASSAQFVGPLSIAACVTLAR